MSDDYYANNQARLNTILGGDQRFFTQLHAARDEFIKIHGEPDFKHWYRFQSWLVDQYGVEMGMTAGGLLKTDYKIVDEMKYMLFVIKFSGR